MLAGIVVMVCMLPACVAHPNLLKCTSAMTVGSVVGGGHGKIVESPARTIQLTKDGAAIACGGKIQVGTPLGVEVTPIWDANDQYAVEITNSAGTCTVKGAECTGTRYAKADDDHDHRRSGDAPFTATVLVPASGTVTARAVWNPTKKEKGALVATADCTYEVEAVTGASAQTCGEGGGGGGGMGSSADRASAHLSFAGVAALMSLLLARIPA